MNHELTYTVKESNHIEAEYRGVRFTGTYYGFTKPPRWFFSADHSFGNANCGLGFEEKKAKGAGKSEFEKLFTLPAENGVKRMMSYIDERLDGDAKAA